MIMQIFAAEINFEDAPHARQKFAGTKRSIKRTLHELQPHVEEVYVLSTPERFSIYIVHTDLVPLFDFLHAKLGLNGCVQYYYSTEESVTHIFATASGLLSAVKGDPNILSLIEKNYQWAAETLSLGISLDRMLQMALEVGKAVRTASGIDQFCGSIVEAGISALYTKLENLHEKHFLIAGTGKMARLALQYLRAEGIKNIVLTAHHFERAQQLGREFDVQVIPIEKASIFFQRSDVVIGAAQQQVKIDWTALKNGGTGPSGQKKNRFILDFGIPPNFDPRLGVAFDADCFTFDDLRRLHTSPTELFGGFELAWTMVMKESQRFVGALLQLHQSPVLTAYLSRVFRDQEDGKRATAMDAIRHFFVRRADRLYPSQNSHPKNSRTLSNNCRPENPSEIVRHVRKIKTFKLPLAYN